MKRTHCSACGSADLTTFLDLGNSPVADAYAETAEASFASARYPLQVAVCEKCWLVQLLEVLSGQELFGTGYSFYSSASAPLSAYHKAYAAKVLRQYGDLAARGVVEIGSNDGDLLRHFSHLPHVGVDPSRASKVARDRGLVVWPSAFTLDLAEDLPAEFNGDRPGVIIANHVIAHVEDVSDALAGIAHLLADDGVAILEVQYLPDLLVNNAFDLVYHEHRNFFSLNTLSYAAALHGLYVVDAELTDRQGGSLRATFAKTGGGMAQTPATSEILLSERWLGSFGAYEGMQGRAERIRTRLLQIVNQMPPMVLYGASAKATTLLNFCGLTVDQIPGCVDTTPAKQHRFIPGTGIPIRSPETAGGTHYLLGAHNYASSVVDPSVATWVIPFPAPMVLG